MAAIADRLDFVIARYAKAGVTLVPLRINRDKNFYKNNFMPLVEALHPQHILVAGGDGTVNRYINFAKPAGLELPIAILPAGTANDFAKMLGMNDNLRKSLDQILGGTIHKLDLGRVNDRYFINILSGGLMTDVSQKTPTAMKNIFGRVAYFFSVIGELPVFKKMRIRISAGEIDYHGECLMFMVFNGRTAGNLPVAKNSSAEDGLLEVIVIKGDNIVSSIGDLFHILLGNKGNYPDDIVYFRAPRLEIECGKRIPTDVDGESGPQMPMSVECLRGALSVIY